MKLKTGKETNFKYASYLLPIDLLSVAFPCAVQVIISLTAAKKENGSLEQSKTLFKPALESLPTSLRK